MLYRPKGLHTANMPSAIPDFRGTQLALPFITIAQQIGAEVPELPRRLAEVLSTRRGGRVSKWSTWDQELIEKVSADANIPAEAIADLEVTGHSWVDDMLQGLSSGTDEFKIFRSVRATVRALASSGNAILIGHGSTYMTAGLPAGLRIRLIAPAKYRLEQIAIRQNLTPRNAAKYIRRMERGRQAFISRFWPTKRAFSAETFAAILNVAELKPDQLVRAIAAMVPGA
jgi:cytidylate kinase